MRRIRKKLIMMVSFYSMQSATMERVTEAHPFMLSNVHESLQTIKDNGLYDSDDNNPEIQDARRVFQDNAKQGPWIEGQWDDGRYWKASTRCGLGLCTLLTGNTKKGKELILDAAQQEHSAWARYYVGIFVLVKPKKPDRISMAWNCFKTAHEDNPNHIVSHWYRHIMAMVGWESELKDNWVGWFDRWLCEGFKTELSYPLAVYAHNCRDQVGAELMCLQVAAEHEGEYQDKALRRLYHYCISQKDGTAHPYAQEAESIMHAIAARSDEDHTIHEVIRTLQRREKAKKDL